MAARPLIPAWLGAILWAGHAFGQCQYLVTVIPGQDCPVYGPQDIQAYSLNEAGQMVGDYNDCDFFENFPFIWDPGAGFAPIQVPGRRVELGTAHDINDLGQAVGGVGIWNDGFVSVGFLFDGTSVVFLGSLRDAVAINNPGQIVGMAYDAQNLQHAFLSTTCWTCSRSGGRAVVPASPTSTATASWGSTIFSC